MHRITGVNRTQIQYAVHRPCMNKSYKSNLSVLAAGFLAITFFAQVAWSQTTRLVGPAGAYTTIQSAISASSAGDIIEVAPGIYNENLSINKSLTLVGPNDTVAALPESGWVRGPEAIVGSLTGGTRVVISNAVTVNIRGFKFRGPSTSNAMGMNIQAGTSGVISNNWFDNLTKTSSFGGADIYTTAACGPWEFRGNRFDGRGYKYYSGDADEGTYGYSAINAWYVNDVTIHGNRIERYGSAGIQLENTMKGTITSNYIKNVATNGIQVANGASTGVVIQGNTVDGASLLYEPYFDVLPIDPEYGWAGIRIWQVATSSNGGTSVLNNKVINIPERIGAIGFVGSNAIRQTVGAVAYNSIDASNGDGLLHIKAAVRSVRITNGVATLSLWEGSSNTANGIARTNHEVGQNVLVSDLGAPFNGTHPITAVAAPASTDFFGDTWFYKTISFEVIGADMTETFVQQGAAASELDSAVSIPAANNWFGAAGGPGATGASLNSAGASAVVEPWILSFAEGSAPSGFIEGVGFWPTSVVSSDADTDQDGLTDGDEVTIYFTDRNNPDTDGDGLTDGVEVLTYLTSPLSADTDGDYFDDAFEVANGSNPLDMDDPILMGDTPEEGMAAYLQSYASDNILTLDLALFNAKNNNARKGQRTSLANRMFAASVLVLDGEWDAAIENVQSVLSKTSAGTVEKTTWLVSETTYVDLLEILDYLVYLRDR